MTDTPTKPKRRRWRWLVGALICLGVGTAGWRYWPRVEDRFVGKWRVFDANAEKLVPADVVMTISTSGWMTQTSEESSRALTFGCWSEGSQLVVDPSVRPGWDGLRSRLDNLLQRLRGEPQSDLSIRFTVESATDNELSIESLASFGRKNRFVWKRMLE